MSTHCEDQSLGAPLLRSRRHISLLLWSAGLLVAAGAAWFVLIRTGFTDRGDSLIIVAWVMLFLSVGIRAWARGRQRRIYWDEFPSLDVVRRRIDVNALRSVRESRGEVTAVRQLRRAVPGMPFVDAAQLINDL